MMKLLPIIVFGLFSFFLLKPNFSASLGMIDDHEIPLFLGSDGKINLLEIPSVVMSTEVGEYGKALRYRPSYFFLRVIETSMWRDNASLWYLARYLLTVVAMVLLFRIASFFFPSIISYLLVLYTYTLPFWPDILNRLGPSEIYAVPALLLFVYGLIKQLKNEGGLWQLAAGYLICVGAKENLIVLLPIIILLAGLKLWKRQGSSRELITYAILLVFTLWVGAEIIIATTHAGTDVYGTQISYTERLLTLYKYKRYIFETRHLHMVAIAMAIAGWRLLKRKGEPSHLVVMTTLLALVASQYLFYNNSLPTHMRYDFPGMLLFPALQLTALHYLLSQLLKNIWSMIIRGATYYCLFMCLLVMIFVKGYGHIIKRGHINAELSSNFASKLMIVTNKLRENPDYFLVMTSDYYLDFEPITAVERFLVARGIKNKLMLDYREHELEEGNSLMAELLPRIYAIEKVGNSEEIFENFSPLMIPSDGKCYSVTFAKELSSPCEHLVSF